ncbi:MAG: NAD(P)-dependent oxidoreductase [Comamonadaceae bacterium]|nr:MAG: NAD(P)-dependent oxidoreductase [Comamonadaceae bacterium]
MSIIAFVGLGAMGDPMARRLAQAGHQVRGIDASADVQTRWEHAHGRPEGDADAILFCVTDEAASRRVVAEAVARAAPGTLLVDHTTTSADWSREADALARAAGLRWCDAPLSGGADGAARGELVAMAGAHADDLPDLRALLAPVTREVVHLGPPGSGQLGKMANQLAIAGIAAGLAQVQSFGRAAGLDLAQVYQVLLQGTARSVQLERLHAELAVRDAASAFRWLDKDLALCQQASSAPLPLVQLWQDLWEQSA